MTTEDLVTVVVTAVDVVIVTEVVIITDRIRFSSDGSSSNISRCSSNRRGFISNKSSSSK